VAPGGNGFRLIDYRAAGLEPIGDAVEPEKTPPTTLLPSLPIEFLGTTRVKTARVTALGETNHVVSGVHPPLS
jgi:hypothetical protein